MSGRSSSVRLRSALGKVDQADNTSPHCSGGMTVEKTSRSSRRTNGHHNLVNGHHSNNGNSTSTRSQSRTRGNSSGSGVSPMEVDGDENSSVVGSSSAGSNTDPPLPAINSNHVSDSKSNNSGGSGNNNSTSGSSNVGKGLSGPTSSSSNNNNNNNDEGKPSTENETSKTASAISSNAAGTGGGGDSSFMEVEVSSSESSSSDSSDSSDSEDSSEMDESSSEKRKLEYQSELVDMDKQFQYLRELLYQERMSAITTKLEEVRSGKAKEYLGPLAQLQENMRVRMEVTANLRQFRLVNVQHKFEAEDLAIRQNFESEKQLLHDSIKTDLEDKIRRLEEDRNNDFTSELWLETALKRKNKKSIDLFGDKKKKPVTVSGPYLVYMLNDVDIVEDWTVIKKALAAPKRKHPEMVY